MKYLLITCLLTTVLLSCKEDTEKYIVKKSTIVESVYSSATVEPSVLYKVYPQTPGQLIQFNKKVGDSIAFGETLCLIDALNAETSKKNAALGYQLAQSQLSGNNNVLQDMQYEIDIVQEQFELDSINFVRHNTLHKKGITSDVEFEQIKLKYENSRVRLKSLKNKMNRMERELKIQSEQAQNIYISSLATSNDAHVKSLIKGTIYDIYKEPGELVMSQEPIALVGTSNDFELHLLLDEVDITKVEIGQRVIVDLEAYPDTLFEARIVRIYPTMNRLSQTFEVIATFTSPPHHLYNGLTGEANIIIAQRKEAIVIPRNYLIDDKWVQTESGKIEVKTGLKSLDEIEVIDGLEEGMILILTEE